MHEIYLGDAVYAKIESGMIKLWTSDGNRETNAIYLESEVYYNLIQWLYSMGINPQPPKFGPG